MERLNIITAASQLLQNASCLPLQLFDENNRLHPFVKDHLLLIYKTLQQRFVSFFPCAEIRDAVLAGSMCSYIYNDKSDLDLFIFADNIIPDDPRLTQHLTVSINKFLATVYWRPFVYGHPVDFGLLSTQNVRYNKRNHYSLLTDSWSNQPVRQKFAFTAEELADKYETYYQNVKKYMDALEKDAKGFLTPENCNRAQNYLQGMISEAFDSKEYFKEHEYCEAYNLWRLFKHSGAYTAFQNYISRSFRNADLIRQQEEANRHE